MQLGASGSDSPLIQGPTARHRAVTPASLFCVRTRQEKTLGSGGRWSKGRLRNASKEFQKRRDFKANGGHTWLVQFGTTNAHD